MVKRLISLIVFTWVAISLVAQCDLPHKPLSEFNKDTTAFMIYNFMDREGCYKGKTLEEVTADLGMPVKYSTKTLTSRGALFTGITIYI
ncbi:MAG: hypothetical protein ACK5M3_18315 [Dysgonomonas sp.]